MKNSTLILSVFLAALLTLVFTSLSFAEEKPMKDVINKEYQESRDICNVVKKTIRDNPDTKQLVKASIELGHEACLVIRCAIEANGNLEQIITGALEAGTTSDVCSRCAIDAGVDAVAVAKILQTGLGYSTPQAVLTPIGGLPGGTPGGGLVSSHRF